MKRTKPTTVYACVDCGSIQVELEVWYDPNAQTYTNTDQKLPVYCRRCKEPNGTTLTILRTRKGWKNKGATEAFPTLLQAIRKSIHQRH